MSYTHTHEGQTAPPDRNDQASPPMPNGQTAPPPFSLPQQIGTIADALYRDRKKVRSGGLLGGNAGITLFFAYLTKSYPGLKYEDRLWEYLETLANTLSNDPLPYNMSAGVAGIAFVFQHLRNIGLLDAAEDINLAELDEMISAGAQYDSRIGRWDPLHGLVGLGIYFIERYRETGDKHHLEKIVDQLTAMTSIENGYIVWITPGFGNVSKDNYNFGMAHGMPGLLSFLAQVYELGIRQDAITAMTNACLSFLLTHRNGSQRWQSFPGAIEVKPDPEEGNRKVLPARHGWCYGDLGMAAALIHCGRSLNRKDWYDTGIDIALTTTLIPFEHAQCFDASLCHGSMGLAHQYHRLFRATGNYRFRDAADYWLAITRDHFYQPGKYAGGYPHNSYEETTGKYTLVSSYGLLEGIAGIGLAWLSLQSDTRPEWDIILLTNI